jgi:hypothetical protein
MLAMSGVVVRIAAATIFVLSAAWKVAEPEAFARAFLGLAPRSIRSVTGPARYGFAALEIALAGTFVVGIFDRTVAVGGGLAAFVIVSSFSMRVARTRGLRECGCWAMPFVADASQARSLILIRNGIVVLTVTAAASTPAELTIAGVAGGLLFGLLIVEAPQLLAVATHHRIWMAAR